MKKLTEVTPQTPPGLRSRFLIPDDAKAHNVRVLVVEFSGEYPPGSLGNEHGAYIASTTLHGLHVFEPWCVVLDLRALSYRWGNTLVQVFSDIHQWTRDPDVPDAAPFPVIVVGSELCSGALKSLLGRSFEKKSCYFEDLDAAIDAAIGAAQAWIDA